MTHLSHCVGADGSRSQIFQFLPGNWRNEIEIIRSVETVSQIFTDSAKIFVGGTTKVNGRNVRNGVTAKGDLTLFCFLIIRHWLFQLTDLWRCLDAKWRLLLSILWRWWVEPKCLVQSDRKATLSKEEYLTRRRRVPMKPLKIKPPIPENYSDAAFAKSFTKNLNIWQDN